MLDMNKENKMKTLEILTSKSKALANNIKTIENAGYTIKYAGDFKMFDDVDSGVTILDTDNTELMTWTPKGYEATFIFADNEGREVRIDTSLVSKTLLSKLKADEVGVFQMANIVSQTEKMNLDFLKVKTYRVEYSKDMEGWEKSSFTGLDKQIEELSHF